MDEKKKDFMKVSNNPKKNPKKLEQNDTKTF